MNINRKTLLHSFFLIFVLLIVGCSSGPVRLSTTESVDIDYRRSRTVSATACGFQLLILFPIRTNSRFQRAYNELVYQAGRDHLRDIKIQESWWYGFVGTTHCTHLVATVSPK